MSISVEVSLEWKGKILHSCGTEVLDKMISQFSFGFPNVWMNEWTVETIPSPTLAGETVNSSYGDVWGVMGDKLIF